MFQFRRFPPYLDVSVQAVPSIHLFDSVYGTGVLLRWVSPFRDPRIDGCLLLPGAFRSLPRLSSAPSAKAFALRPSSLDRLSCSRFSYLPTRYFTKLQFYNFFRISRSYYSVFKVHPRRKAPRLPSAAPKCIPHSEQPKTDGLYSLSLRIMVGSSGLEPPTSRLSGARSNHLSYEPIWWR